MSPSPRLDSANDGWRVLPALATGTLEATTLTLHHAVQPLSAFGQSLVEPRGDDTHRAMTWDAGRDAFLSGVSDDGLQVVLEVPTFTLEVTHHGEPFAALKLHGQSLDAGMLWLEEVLTEKRASVPSLAWPEYDLPDHPGGREIELRPDGPSLQALAAWYGNASSLLEPLAANAREASPVRCWPHHFDLATLLTFSSPDADGDARYVGIGFSPGDDSVSTPYYYVNGWPSPMVDQLPPLEGAGSWISKGWVGAVLSAGEIVAVVDPAEQRSMVASFLHEASSAMRSILGTP